MVINVTVRGKCAHADKTIYVCDNTDYVIKTDFSDEWATETVKTARFKYNGHYVDIVFEGDSVNVPRISGTNVIEVGFYAGNLSTTTPAIINCRRSILDGEGTPDEPTADVYSQIIEIANDAVNKSENAVETAENALSVAQDVERRANAGEFDGKDYVLTEEDKDEIAEKSAELIDLSSYAKQSEVDAIQQALSEKMEFYLVTLDGYPMQFKHGNEVLGFTELADKYNDPKYFLYCEYASITFIPSLPPVDDPIHPDRVLEFSANWHYDGAHWLTSIKINESNQIKIEEDRIALEADLESKAEQSAVDSLNARIEALESKVK